MKRIKHSKVKNTGLIFELLVRQVASDTMNNKNSKALSILKKHYNSKSELTKELKLYRTLSEEKFTNETKAEKFVEAVLKARKNINESQLRRDKYNLIKDLKSNYIVEDFFKSRVKNYKLHASTYKLFEYAEADDPKEYITSKFALVEHVQSLSKKPESAPTLTSENKDVRILASKIVVDKFNERYSGLSSSQKKMLREYINNVTNSVKLRKYILTEIRSLRTSIKSLRSTIPSKVIRIKLNEVNNLLITLGKKHLIEDKDVLTMLRYYELVNELKKVMSTPTYHNFNHTSSSIYNYLGNPGKYADTLVVNSSTTVDLTSSNAIYGAFMIANATNVQLTASNDAHLLASDFNTKEIYDISIKRVAIGGTGKVYLFKRQQ